VPASPTRQHRRLDRDVHVEPAGVVVLVGVVDEQQHQPRLLGHERRLAPDRHRLTGQQRDQRRKRRVAKPVVVVPLPLPPPLEVRAAGVEAGRRPRLADLAR
jgi:hypothetical protein